MVKTRALLQIRPVKCNKVDLLQLKGNFIFEAPHTANTGYCSAQQSHTRFTQNEKSPFLGRDTKYDVKIQICSNTKKPPLHKSKPSH